MLSKSVLKGAEFMRPVDTECAMEQFARVRFLRAAPQIIIGRNRPTKEADGDLLSVLV